MALRPRRLQGLRPARMLTTFAAGHGWTGGDGATGFNLNDTSDGALASQCVSWTTSGNGNVGGQRVAIKSPTLAAFDLTQYDLAVWYKLTTPDAINVINVTVTDGTNGYSYGFFQQSPAGQATAGNPYPVAQHILPASDLTSDWQIAVFDLSTANNFGAPTGTTKTALTNITLGAYDFGGGVKGSGKFGGVALVPKAATAYPNGVITIGLDDGYVSQWTAAKPALDKYGFPAVAYVIQDLIPDVYAGGQYLGLDQLHRLEDQSGWEVAAHSAFMADHNQTNAFGALSDAALRANVEKHKQWLISNGFRGADHFAYPQGKYTPQTVKIIRDYFTTARTVAFGNMENPFRPGDPLRMRCIPVDSALSLATLQARVDAIKANRSWGQFYLHQIIAGPTGTSTTPAIFSGLIDYIAAQGIPVRTVSDVLALR